MGFMLLVITRSLDITADLLFKRLGHSAFRLNFDLWGDYSLILEPNRWEIANPAGLKITSESATHCFWWKAFLPKIPKHLQATTAQQPQLQYNAKDDSYVAAEVGYIFREHFSRTLWLVSTPWIDRRKSSGFSQ
jgi:hypothetical protein